MSGRRTLAVVVSIVMAAAVGAGLWVNGTPAQQRLASMDAQRINRLRNLSFRIESYGDQHHEAPERLAQVAPDPDDLLDPVSKAPIEYRSRGRAYTLCAVFDTAADEPPTDEWRFTRHAKGHVCFDRSIDAPDKAPDPTGESADP